MGGTPAKTLVLAAILAPCALFAGVANAAWVGKASYYELKGRTASGGHVGFHAADSATPWHDRCIGMFMDAVLR